MDDFPRLFQPVVLFQDADVVGEEPLGVHFVHGELGRVEFGGADGFVGVERTKRGASMQQANIWRNKTERFWAVPFETS